MSVHCTGLASHPPHHPGMDCRRFLLTSLTSAFAVPRGAGAQQAGRMYRIGYLFDARPPDETSSPLRALEENLRGLGYVEGKNLVVERRFAAFKYDRLATELTTS
jgi:hypothetical protein